MPWIEPPSVFSTGTAAYSVVPAASAAKTSSNDAKPRHVTARPADEKISCAAASEYAPGSPWKPQIVEAIGGRGE